MKPYSWTDWFTDVGKVIKSANRCTALADDLDGDKTGLDAIFDDDAGDLDYLSDVLTTVDSARDSGTGSMSQFSELVSDYIRGIGRLKLEQTDTHSSQRKLGSP